MNYLLHTTQSRRILIFSEIFSPELIWSPITSSLWGSKNNSKNELNQSNSYRELLICRTNDPSTSLVADVTLISGMRGSVCMIVQAWGSEQASVNYFTWMRQVFQVYDLNKLQVDNLILTSCFISGRQLVLSVWGISDVLQQFFVLHRKQTGDSSRASSELSPDFAFVLLIHYLQTPAHVCHIECLPESSTYWDIMYFKDIGNDKDFTGRSMLLITAFATIIRYIAVFSPKHCVHLQK